MEKVGVVIVVYDARTPLGVETVDELLLHSLELATSFQILNIFVNAAHLARDVDTLWTMLVTLLTAHATVCLTLLLHRTIITHEECTACLAEVLVLR
jgi:hypothetical protein